MPALYDLHSHCCYSDSVSMLCCATSYDSWMPILELKQKRHVARAIGLHPWFIGSRPEYWKSELENYLSKDCSLSIGECGLDFHRGVNRDEQLEVFEKHLELAVAYQRPLSIHSVRCWPEMLSLLSLYQVPKGSVIHRFGGSLEIAEQCISKGVLISLGPEILHGRSPKTERLIREIPLCSFVLESDAEAGTAEPASLLHRVYEEVATIRGLEVSELVEQIGNTCSSVWG